jgi:hypothetical protein
MIWLGDAAVANDVAKPRRSYSPRALLAGLHGVQPVSRVQAGIVDDGPDFTQQILRRIELRSSTV